MNQLLTTGIILSRTDYGEADRIITLLTPEQGKLRLMARGVRKVKSKLAGGIELFSVSDITYIRGKGEIGTLISARLNQHYGNIIRQLARVQLGYELIKILNKATEDHPEAEYFHLLEQGFAALNDELVDLQLIRTWFEAQLLKLGGHTPNLLTDSTGHRLSATQLFDFEFNEMMFSPRLEGKFSASHVKLLRLLFSDNLPGQLANVEGVGKLLPHVVPLVQTILATYIS